MSTEIQSDKVESESSRSQHRLVLMYLMSIIFIAIFNIYFDRFRILLFSENVTIEFSGQDGPAFKGTKQGSIYLTTHRMIFNAKHFEDTMKSFSFPFICLNEVEVEQPMFGANYIRGKVRAQPDGNFIGEAKFKLIFKSGGAIEFAQAMLRSAHMAQQNAGNMDPPPYSPPSGDWHQGNNQIIPIRMKTNCRHCFNIFFVLFFIEMFTTYSTTTSVYSNTRILWMATNFCISKSTKPEQCVYLGFTSSIPWHFGIFESRQYVY